MRKARQTARPTWREMGFIDRQGRGQTEAGHEAELMIARAIADAFAPDPVNRRERRRSTQSVESARTATGVTTRFDPPYVFLCRRCSQMMFRRRANADSDHVSRAASSARVCGLDRFANRVPAAGPSGAPFGDH